MPGPAHVQIVAFIRFQIKFSFDYKLKNFNMSTLLTDCFPNLEPPNSGVSGLIDVLRALFPRFFARVAL